MDAPVNFSRHVRLEQEASADSFNFTELVEQLRGFVRRQLPIFIFITACSLALGLVYLLTAAPKFTSHAMLLIDSSKVRILQQQQTPIGDIPIDTAHVETQVEILKSESIGLSVIKDLKLTADPEFVGSGGGLLGKIMGNFLFAGNAVARTTRACGPGDFRSEKVHFAGGPNLRPGYRLYLGQSEQRSHNR